MQQFLLIMQALNAMMPTVIATVKAIEDALPVSGQGQAKLEMVRSVLSAAYAQVQSVQVAFDQVWPVLSAFIGALVTVYNTAGVFKKQ